MKLSAIRPMITSPLRRIPLPPVPEPMSSSASTITSPALASVIDFEYWPLTQRFAQPFVVPSFFGSSPVKPSGYGLSRVLGAPQLPALTYITPLKVGSVRLRVSTIGLYGGAWSYVVIVTDESLNLSCVSPVNTQDASCESWAFVGGSSIFGEPETNLPTKFGCPEPFGSQAGPSGGGVPSLATGSISSLVLRPKIGVPEMSRRSFVCSGPRTTSPPMNVMSLQG